MSPDGNVRVTSGLSPMVSPRPVRQGETKGREHFESVAVATVGLDPPARPVPRAASGRIQSQRVHEQRDTLAVTTSGQQRRTHRLLCAAST